jgi:glycosyltransferase involved in cell wall biosynthesis
MVSESASPLAVPGGLDGDGQNLHVHELSRALAGQGHQVSVYTRRDSPQSPERVASDCGYDVVHVPAGPAAPLARQDILPYMKDFTQFLYREWRVNPPDVAHAHFWTSGLATCLAGKHTSTPIVQTYHALGSAERRHEGEAGGGPGERVRIERLVGREAGRVIATCGDEVADLLRMGVSRRKVRVVPAGVDTETFTPTGPAARKHAAHRLVAVGRLLPRKRFDTIIGVLPHLPGTELVIAGGPDGDALAADPEADRLVGIAEDAGVAERVHLLGSLSRDAMPALLRSADAVVCTPTDEPLGIVSLEAMACGVPVVASAVGGLADAVVDRVTGLHLPPGDSAALGAALRAVLTDPLRRQAMGAAGRDRVASRYGWDRIGAETLRVYEHAGQAASAEGSRPSACRPSGAG